MAAIVKKENPMWRKKEKKTRDKNEKQMKKNKQIYF
jgi:hypothetical protein